VLYCNSFEVSHNKEVFCLILKFQKPDGGEIPIYVVINPQGCKTLLNGLTEQMTSYESENGKVEAWTAGKTGDSNGKKSEASLYS